MNPRDQLCSKTNELRLRKSQPWHHVIESCVGNTRQLFLVHKHIVHTLNVFVPYEIKMGKKKERDSFSLSFLFGQS